MKDKYEVFSTKTWDELPKCVGSTYTIRAAKCIVTKTMKTTQFVWVVDKNGDKVVL
jgi:hypothetical protein